MKSFTYKSYTRPQLYIRMWTDEDIDTFLGDPTEWSRTTHDPNKVIPRWAWHVVHEIERSEEMKERRAQRQSIAPEVVQSEAEDFMASMNVRMTALLTREELISVMYPIRQYSTNSTYPDLHNVKVLSFIRHQCTNYEELLADAKRRGVTAHVYEPLVREVTKVVTQNYPEFAEVSEVFLRGKFRYKDKKKRRDIQPA